MNKKILLSLLFVVSGVVAVEEIPPIIIYAHSALHKTATSLNTQSLVQTIVATQFTASGSSSLFDALNYQGGIQVIEPNGISGRRIFSMRGFGDNAASNVLILLDGQPCFNPDMGALSINDFSLAEIKQVEATASSSSVLYGDQAVGGVVNIITKEPEAKTNEITASYGNFATHEARLSLGNMGKNSFAYHLGVATYASHNYRAHNYERNDNLFIHLAYQDIYFRYRKNTQYIEMPGKLTWLQVMQNPRQAENDISYNEQDNNILQFGFKHPLTATADWVARLDTAVRLMQGGGVYAANQRSFAFNESRGVATIQPKISGVINFWQHSILPTLGVDLNYGKYTINASQARQNQTAFYSQFTLPVTPTVTAVGGARYGLAFYHLADETIANKKPLNRAFVTNLELSWQALNSLRIFAKRAESYRFPKTDEIMFTLDKVPLEPQRGISYEVGAIYNHASFSGSLTAYGLNLKKEIFAVPVATSSYYIFNQNLDSTRRIGAVVDLNLAALKYLHLNANYNFVNAKFIAGDFAGKKIPFVAANNLRLAAILKPYEKLQLLVEALYTGKRYPINDVENRMPQLGGFTLYNCGISYEAPHYTLTLRGNNLTNKLYYGYVIATYQGAATNNWYYPSSGTNLLVSLTFKL